MEALWKVKDGVEGKKEEAFIEVMEEIEDETVASMKMKEDVEGKVGPVKMFLQGRMLDPISAIKTNTTPTFSTISTAMAAATVHDRDSSDSSKGSAESLDDEKLKSKSGKRHSNKIEGTMPSITYSGVSSPVDVIVHKSHEEQIFYPKVKYSGVQERTEKNHQAEKDNIEEATEICLEKLYQKQWSHEFYCPNCKTCITKVIIRERYSEPAPPTVTPPDKEKLRCTNCFSFLIPTGSWIGNIFGSKNQDTISSISYPVSVNSCPVDIHQSHREGIFHSGVKYPGVQESAVKKHQTGKDNIENKDKIQDQNISYTCLEKGTTSGHGKVDYLGMKNGEGVAELYLEKLYQKQESHEFYCPNCNTCITKVLIIRERYYPEPAPPAVVVPDKEELRCANCFSFLVPAGNWIRNMFARKSPTGQATVIPTSKPINPGNSTTGLEEPLGPHYLDKNLGDQIPGNPQTVGHIVPWRSQPSEPIIPHLGDNLSHGAVENTNAEEATEICLEKLFQSQEPHEFYCPNCMSRITKVFIVRERDREPKVIDRDRDREPRPLPESESRCTSCVSFLIAAGNWLMDRFTPTSQIGQDPGLSGQIVDIVHHKPDHGKGISYCEVLRSPSNSNKSLQDQNGNLYQKESQCAFRCPSCSTSITDVVKRSFIGGQMLEVKICLKVATKKMSHLLPFKKKDGLWDCYSADAKTVDASDDVHTRQTKTDASVSKVKHLWHRKKNRNLDNGRKTSKVFDNSSFQEVIDEEGPRSRKALVSARS